MEHYIIELTIDFDPVECTLKQHETNEEISLPFVACKILELLLQNQGTVISREYIFDSIFEKNGTSCTNNNLNQYISLLRKFFISLQCESHIITTVPKIGFIINNDIDIQLITPHYQEENIPPRKTQGFKIINFVAKDHITTTVCLFFILIVISILLMQMNKTEPADWIPLTQYTLRNVETEKNCKAFNLSSDHSVANKHIQGYNNDINHTINVMCNADGDTFYVSESQWDEIKYRYFLLQCRNESQKTSCISHYKSVER